MEGEVEEVMEVGVEGEEGRQVEAVEEGEINVRKAIYKIQELVLRIFSQIISTAKVQLTTMPWIMNSLVQHFLRLMFKLAVQEVSPFVALFFVLKWPVCGYFSNNGRAVSWDTASFELVKLIASKAIIYPAMLTNFFP